MCSPLSVMRILQPGGDAEATLKDRKMNWMVDQQQVIISVGNPTWNRIVESRLAAADGTVLVYSGRKTFLPLALLLSCAEAQCCVSIPQCCSNNQQGKKIVQYVTVCCKLWMHRASVETDRKTLVLIESFTLTLQSRKMIETQIWNVLLSFH